MGSDTLIGFVEVFDLMESLNKLKRHCNMLDNEKQHSRNKHNR